MTFPSQSTTIARVIIRNSPQSKKAELLAMFRSQNIYPAL